MDGFVRKQDVLDALQGMWDISGRLMSPNQKKQRVQVLCEAQTLVQSIPCSKDWKIRLMSKGFWRITDKSVVCSVCGNEMLGLQKYSFCPNCGAVMSDAKECG